MKSVLEIAKENGVSVQSVYKKINKTMVNELNGCIKKGERGETLINKHGEQLLMDSFNKSVQSKVERVVKSGFIVYPETEEVINGLNSRIDSLEARNLKLEEEIGIERSHSREKSDQIAGLAEKLVELTRNSQIMQHANSPRILESGDPEERKSFWKRLFG